MEEKAVIRRVLEEGLNRVRLVTFHKHGEEAREAARGAMRSAAMKLAGQHYRFGDELPHLARFVGHSLPYPYSMKVGEGITEQFTKNFYRAAGVVELVAGDFMLRRALGVNSKAAVERTAPMRRAAMRFVDEFYARGGLSEKAVKDLEAAVGAKRLEKLQERVPEAEHEMEEVLKKFLEVAPKKEKKAFL